MSTEETNVRNIDDLIAAVARAQNQRQVMTTEEVLDALRISRATMYRLMSLGLFPKPIKLGLRKNGWHRSVIDAYLADRAAIAA